MRFAAEMHSKWENLHVWRNSHFSQDEDHNKQKGEWIHLVLLGMANRCQMGINGPPNVLLQKAFFSAQYFPYIDDCCNTYIINLQKEIFRQKKIFCEKIVLMTHTRYQEKWIFPSYKAKLNLTLFAFENLITDA